MQIGFIPNNTLLFSGKVRSAERKTEVDLSPANYKVIKDNTGGRIMIIPEMNILVESDIFHGVPAEYNSIILGADTAGFRIQTDGETMTLSPGVTVEIRDYSVEIDMNNVTPADDNTSSLYIDVKYTMVTAKPDTGTPDIGTPDIDTPDIGTPDIDTGTPGIDTDTSGIDTGTPGEETGIYSVKGDVFKLLEEEN